MPAQNCSKATTRRSLSTWSHLWNTWPMPESPRYLSPKRRHCVPTISSVRIDSASTVSDLEAALTLAQSRSAVAERSPSTGSVRAWLVDDLGYGQTHGLQPEPLVPSPF